MLYIQMMHIIGVVYDRSDQVAQMLNQLRKRVAENVQAQVIPIFTDFEDLVETTYFDSQQNVDEIEDSIFKMYTKHLSVQLQVLRGLDICFNALGPEYSMVEEVQHSRSKEVGVKRSLEDSQMHDQSMTEEQAPVPTIFDLGSESKSKNGQLFKHDLVQIKRVDVMKDRLLTEAKIKLARQGLQVSQKGIRDSEEVEGVAQMLIEIEEVELALELSIQFNL